MCSSGDGSSGLESMSFIFYEITASMIAMREKIYEEKKAPIRRAPSEVKSNKK